MTIELTFRVLDHHPNDGWSRDGERITDTAHLDRVRSAFAAFRILVIKHWHYRGARAPNHVVVEDFDEFLAQLSRDRMLTEQCRGGPDDRSVDGISELLPRQPFRQAGYDDLFSDLVSGHVTIIGRSAADRLVTTPRSDLVFERLDHPRELIH